MTCKTCIQRHKERYKKIMHRIYCKVYIYYILYLFGGGKCLGDKGPEVSIRGTLSGAVGNGPGELSWSNYPKGIVRMANIRGEIS